MAVTMIDLGIDRLSVEERLNLVHDIWDSIAAANDLPPLTEEQQRLFEQRLADLDTNPGNVLTWDEIKRSVRGER